MQTQGHDKAIGIHSPGLSHQDFLVHGHISKNVGECDLVFDDHLRHAVLEILTAFGRESTQNWCPVLRNLAVRLDVAFSYAIMRLSG